MKIVYVAQCDCESMFERMTDGNETIRQSQKKPAVNSLPGGSQGFKGHPDLILWAGSDQQPQSKRS